MDSLALFVAPIVLGGDGRGLLGPLGIDALADAPQLRDLRSRPVGLISCSKRSCASSLTAKVAPTR